MRKDKDREDKEEEEEDREKELPGGASSSYWETPVERTFWETDVRICISAIHFPRKSRKT